MWTVHGENADEIADMIEHMSRFLATAGLPGFVAWIEQEYRITADAEAIRRNMERMSAKFRHEFRDG
jgi:nitrogenase molybdenum-iron protein alpha/beta subunit